MTQLASFLAIVPVASMPDFVLDFLVDIHMLFGPVEDMELIESHIPYVVGIANIAVIINSFNDLNK